MTQKDLYTILRFVQSPNRKVGPQNRKVREIILHHTTGSYESAVREFQNAATRKSAHFIVPRNVLQITQMVREDDIASHAGRIDGPNTCNVNPTSIGIEIEAFKEKHGLTPIQDEMLRALVTDIATRHKIPPNKILGHRNVNATLCPSYIWPTDLDLRKWVDSLNLPTEPI